MDKNTIINAVETHFADELHISAVQENGIDIDGEGQLIVTVQAHWFIFNKDLRQRVQRFIDQYTLVPNDANWLRHEDFKQMLGEIEITYHTEMIGDEEHDVVFFIDKLRGGSMPYRAFLNFRASIAAANAETL